MLSQSTVQCLPRSLVLLLSLTFACAGSNGSASASGGAKDGQGGVATGGVSAAGGLGAGGHSDSGGTTGGGGSSSSASGGSTSINGGIAAGGSSASGGATSGTGGAGNGGNGSGGNAAGGVSSGGRIGAGGAGAGGRSNGGATTGGSTAAGGTASGGAGGSATGSSGTGGATGTDPFTLAWQDDFNSFDTSLWQLMSFTYDGNQATFSPNNASVANGKLTLSLTNAPSGSAKPYLGVEMRSTKTITYGKVSASMRFASGSGVVSGLVLFYTPYPNCNWNEIDIEHLGKSTNSSQLNCMIYTGNVVPSCTTSVTPTQDPQVVDLGANAETGFHQYDIEWTPTAVKFSVDGKLLRTWTASIALMNQPLTVLLTIWASSAASWAGAIDSSAIPTSADLDWIKVYSWKG